MRDFLPKLETRNALLGGFVNLEYQIPDGSLDRLLNDGATCLGNQLESTLENDGCFGIAANADFIPVRTYEENGENPEVVIYKRR